MLYISLGERSNGIQIKGYGLELVMTEAKDWGYWEQTIIGEFRKAAKSKKPKGEMARVFFSIFTEMDKNYGRTLTSAGMRIGKSGFSEITTRFDIHAAAENAAREAGEAYAEEQDETKWEWLEACAGDIEKLVESEAAALDDVDRRIDAISCLGPIYKLRSGREAVWAQQARVQVQRNVMRHNIREHYTPLHDKVKNLRAVAVEQRKDGMKVSRDLYVEVKAFEARAEAELDLGYNVVRDVLANLTTAVSVQAFKPVADRIPTDAKDRITSVKAVFVNLQGAAEITAAVVPTETVAKVLEAANSIGQICQNIAFSAWEEAELTRQATAISKDRNMRDDAIAALSREPLLVAKFAVKQNAKDLKEALDLVHPAVAGILSGAAVGLEWTGVGVAVTKPIGLFIWPITVKVITTLFGDLDKAAIKAAEAELEEQDDIVDLKAVQEVARKVGLVAYRSMRDGLTKNPGAIKADILREIRKDKKFQQVVGTLNRKAEEARKEAMKKGEETLLKGFANFSPEGLVEWLAMPVEKIVGRIMAYLPVRPAETFDGLKLLATLDDLRKPTSLEQMMQQRWGVTQE